MGISPTRQKGPLRSAVAVRSWCFGYLDFVTHPCRHAIQAPEDSKGCREADVQMWLSRLWGRSHFCMSASAAHFHTPALYGGALKTNTNAQKKNTANQKYVVSNIRNKRCQSDFFLALNCQANSIGPITKQGGSFHFALQQQYFRQYSQPEQHTRSALVGNKKVLGGERTRVLSKHRTEDRDVARATVLTLWQNFLHKWRKCVDEA